MNPFPLRLLALATLLTAAAALPALAASSTSSAVSDSVGTSVGSSSTSIQKSSDSSTGKDEKRVAAGDYRIVDVTDAADRSGALRLKLQALADGGGEFFLVLPQAAFDQGHLATGQVVTARQRDYGLEFVATQAAQTFFLVLDDERHRELQTTAVRL